MKIIRYTPQDQPKWDAFVRESVNGTFLFERAYMDYHSDRFTDHSLLFFSDKNRLIALLPANEGATEEHGRTLFSHQGLTYGGFIRSAKSTASEVLQLFDLTRQYLAEAGFASWLYKSMPTIYHRLPAQEDEYALWRIGAELHACLLSSTILLGSHAPVQYCRRHGRDVALKAGYRVATDGDLALFWPIMEDNLMRTYGVKPVHTLPEMQRLQHSFPHEIRVFLALDSEGQPQAGIVAYLITPQVVHIQYGHATPKGKEEHALDLLYLSLIERFAAEGYHYFDFGSSNEQGGRYLNENLIAQKEGFGGRGVTYKTYLISLPS